MERRFRWFRRMLLLLGLCCAVGLTVVLLLQDDADSTTGLDDLKINKAEKRVPFKDEEDQMEMEMDAGNTTIGWIARKTIAGKETNVSGGWKGLLGSKLYGEVVVSSDNRILKVVASIDFASLWTEHEILTRMLIKNGFFNTEEHPRIMFASTSIEAVSNEFARLEGATHKITGNLELNGITHSVTFPARIEDREDTILVHSAFNLNRKDFDVVLTNPPAGVMLGDEAIDDKLAVILDVVLPVADGTYLAEEASAGKPEPQAPEPVEETESEAHAPVAAENEAPAQAVPDIKALPASYTETIPYSQVDFQMVLVPGDPDRNLPEFYLGIHEVTWDEFMPWAIQSDVDSEIEKGENRAMKLRPSQPWGQVTRGFGEHGFPALSMSRLAARKYCSWLSVQTGKTYRLPSEEEWEHTYRAGGNRLDTLLSVDEANAVAVYYENCFNEEMLLDATRAVGSKQANALGIFDMAGNVCEWVIPEDLGRVARGGHFMSDRDELRVGRHIEDPDKWNMSYPNEPKSIWWFVDAKWIGFRVVCEAGSVINQISAN